MPLLVLALSLAVFAQGTSEFMLSGLVDPIAAALGVSVAATGWLTSLFAVGMIVGAPLMAVAARRFPPRRALLAFLAVFIAVHVVGALAPGFVVLLVTRVFAALANAGFLAVALAALPSIVGPARTGRATAVLLSGVTLACVVGVPGGAVLGQLWGWRAAFWAVVAASLPALAAVALVRAPASPAAPVNEWRALRSPEVRGWLLLGALVNGATFATFAYLAPVVTDVARLGDGWVPVVLALFGVGSFVGITVAGRLADSRPRLVLGGGSALLLLVWTALAVWPVTVLVFAAGALSFGVGSTLIGRIVSSSAATAPRLGGAFATAAFNTGAAVGPLMAGLVISLTGSYRAPLVVSAACVAVALAMGFRRFRLIAATAPQATARPARRRPSAPAGTP